MINKSLFKTIYYTRYGAKYEIISSCFLQGVEHYTVNDRYPEPEHPRGFGLQIISQEEINADLLHQDEYKAKYEAKEKANQEYAERVRLQEEKEAKEKAELENLYGFDNGLTPMQRGKLLKVLDRKFRYSDLKYNEDTKSFDKINIRILSRKDYILEKINKGLKPGLKTFDNKPYYYIEQEPLWDGTKYIDTMIEITKTEFDFANYLINNSVLQNAHQ